MRGRPSCLLQSAGAEANRILLASALLSMRIICPNKVSRRDWMIAVSLGCFVSLRTSSFRTNWYHLMPSSIRRHHWSRASILHASVLDIAQQSEPYRNIGKMHVLYSFNFVEMASRDLQIWFSKLCAERKINGQLANRGSPRTWSLNQFSVCNCAYTHTHQTRLTQQASLKNLSVHYFILKYGFKYMFFNFWVLSISLFKRLTLR